MLSFSEILLWNTRSRIIALVACDQNPRTSLKRASGEKRSKPQPVCAAFSSVAIFRQIRNRPCHAEVLNTPKTCGLVSRYIVEGDQFCPSPSVFATALC